MTKIFYTLDRSVMDRNYNRNLYEFKGGIVIMTKMTKRGRK